MKGQTLIVTACFCSWLLTIGLAGPAIPQVDSRFQPVHVSKGGEVNFSFRYLRPPIGGDPHGDYVRPGGEGKVTRDDEFTSIDIKLWNLPANPGRYFLYLLEDDNTAQQIEEFRTDLKLLYQTSSKVESFRLAISTKPGLTTITSPRDGVLMISVAP